MYIGIHTTFHVTFLEALKLCRFAASLNPSFTASFVFAYLFLEAIFQEIMSNDHNTIKKLALMLTKAFRLTTVPGLVRC